MPGWGPVCMNLAPQVAIPATSRVNSLSPRVLWLPPRITFTYCKSSIHKQSKLEQHNKLKVIPARSCINWSSEHVLALFSFALRLTRHKLFMSETVVPWLDYKRCFSETNVKCRQNVREIKFKTFLSERKCTSIFYINCEDTSGNMGAVLWASQRHMNMLLVHIFRKPLDYFYSLILPLKIEWGSLHLMCCARDWRQSVVIIGQDLRRCF